jgi:hypothetical protein
LAASWSLPQSLTDVIRHHHHPERSPGNRRLVIIVHLADLLMSRFHTGLELERMGTGHLVNHLGQLALSTGDFQKLVDLIPDPVFAPVAEAL